MAGVAREASETRPRLRPLEAYPVEHEGQTMILVRDPLGFTPNVALVPPPVFLVAALMDGDRSFIDIQAEFAKRTGELLFTETIEKIVRAFDEALFLEGDRFRSVRDETVATFRRETVRKAAHAGAAYPAKAEELHAYCDAILAGRPGSPPQDGGVGPAHAPERRLAAIVAPHIDPRRGAQGYARAYAEVARAGPFDLYVIFGTAHQSAGETFILTAKDFETPFGEAETDRAFLERLEARLAGRDHRRGELAHRTEHSVEFQVVFLQHVHARARRGGWGEGDAPPPPVRIVPLVCGSFHPFTESGRSPAETPDVASFLDALRATIAEETAAGRRVCLLGAADLAHVGLKFGHDRPADDAVCVDGEAMDRASLEPAAAVDAERFFAYIAAERDRRNICGLPCMYSMLKVMGGDGATGTLLDYGQAKDPAAGSMVSFAALAYYR